MISLRKHIDSYREAPPEPSGDPENPQLAALRSALASIGDCGQRAIPSLGSTLGQELAAISRGLSPSPTAEALRSATTEVEAQLTRWAERAIDHHNESERELQDVIGVVARAAEAFGAKDEKYTRQIGDLTGRMRSIAELKDPVVIRRSILESAAFLQTCVERMTEEGKSTVNSLTAEVAEYRARLEESERMAALDPLTQLANRRAFERCLDLKISVNENFSLILIDLNEFKTVNDMHGHIAGDELLRQFAAELRGQFSATDMVCRWGGDEFAVILTGGKNEAEDRVERIRKWVLGEYKVSSGSQSVRVMAEASLGIVQWNGRENPQELLARADEEMYRGKGSPKNRAASRSAARPVRD